MLKQITLASVLLTAAGVASAGTQSGCFNFFFIDYCPAPPTKPSKPTMQAPEIDPSSAMAGLSLLAGGLAVLRGRRFKEPK